MACKSCPEETLKSYNLLISGIREGMLFPDAVAYADFNSCNQAFNVLLGRTPVEELSEVLSLIKWQ
jgi:hypothetical protein